MLDDPNEILTAAEVSKILKISRAMVYKLREDAVLPASFKLFEGDRGWRWARRDVDGFLASRSVEKLLSRDVARPFVPVTIPLRKHVSSQGMERH